MSGRDVADKETQTCRWRAYNLNDREKDLALIESLRDQITILRNDQINRLCHRCRQSNRLRDDTLRMLSDSQPFQPEPRKERVSAVDALRKQTELANTMTKFLQPDAWEQQQKQEQEEREFQENKQREEAKQNRVTRLQKIMQETRLLKQPETDRLDHERELQQETDRLNPESRQERLLLRVLASNPPAATKPVPVPPLTQSSAPSAPRGRMRLAPLQFSGKMEELNS
jgi:hypothetical protein